MRILATLTEADAGQARVAGFDVRHDRSAVRRRISLTGQFAALDEAQTGEEKLRMTGGLSRLSRAAARQRAAELIEQFELAAVGRRRVGTYSGGMRRRLTSPPAWSAIRRCSASPAGCRWGRRWPGAAASWPSRSRSRRGCFAVARPDHGGPAGLTSLIPTR